ncbi:MAG TPA: asparagine synthase-related protein [Candidatus Krumholzibacteria bacterium]|nr:asparagine synthase-related protein [Candidatus Krumholzibacteria bacterium]
MSSHSEFGIRAIFSLGPHVSAPAAGRNSKGMCLFSDDRVHVEAEKPDWYPVRVLRYGSLVIVVEGHLYGSWHRFVGDLDRFSLEQLDDIDAARRLRSFFGTADGEAIALVYDTVSERLVVGADRFARIPLYYHLADHQLIVSRSQRFILAHMGQVSANRAGLSEILLFGYPLEDRTVVSRVSRLLPQEFLIATPNGCKLDRSPTSPFRASGAATIPSFDTCVAELRDEFIATCKDRALPEFHHVLSLSGGMDSRTAGAGMRRALTTFSATTFVAPGSLHADEQALARSVASMLHADWHVYEFRHDRAESTHEIIQTKIGLSPVDVAFGLDYVRRIRDDFGGAVALWTGEGADKLFFENRAVPPTPSIDQLVHFIVSKNALLSPEIVSGLSGIRVDELLENVRSAVNRYPDIEADDAYAHFLLSQRFVRWLSEGEDRHRAATWPISPFFGSTFVELVRSVPSRWKRGRRLYGAFLTALDPEVAGIPLSGGHAAPSTRRFATEYALREFARGNAIASRAYAALRKWRQARYAAITPWHAQLLGGIQSGAVREYLDTDYLASLVRNNQMPGRIAAQVLTAVLAVNSLHEPAASLDSGSHVG